MNTPRSIHYLVLALHFVKYRWPGFQRLILQKHQREMPNASCCNCFWHSHKYFGVHTRWMYPCLWILRLPKVYKLSIILCRTEDYPEDITPNINCFSTHGQATLFVCETNGQQKNQRCTLSVYRSEVWSLLYHRRHSTTNKQKNLLHLEMYTQ